MKAQAKERHRRYASAAGSANHIGQYLNHEPMTAGPPGAGYEGRSKLTTDPDLAALRDRADFRELIESPTETAPIPRPATK